MEVINEIIKLISKNDYKFENMLEENEKAIPKRDLHLIYSLASIMYRQTFNYEKEKEYCWKDFHLTPILVFMITKERFPCVLRLIDILENDGELEKAINLCQFAIKYEFYKVSEYQEKLNKLIQKQPTIYTINKTYIQ